MFGSLLQNEKGLTARDDRYATVKPSGRSPNFRLARGQPVLPATKGEAFIL